jgi:uridylate kinase
MAVPRIGRVMDLAAAALIVVGGGLYVRAYIGLEALRVRPIAEFNVGMQINRLAEFHALERLYFGGLAIAVVGIGVAVSAAVVAVRARRARLAAT